MNPPSHCPPGPSHHDDEGGGFPYDDDDDDDWGLDALAYSPYSQPQSHGEYNGAWDAEASDAADEGGDEMEMDEDDEELDDEEERLRAWWEQEDRREETEQDAEDAGGGGSSYPPLTLHQVSTPSWQQQQQQQQPRRQYLHSPIDDLLAEGDAPSSPEPSRVWADQGGSMACYPSPALEVEPWATLLALAERGQGLGPFLLGREVGALSLTAKAMLPFHLYPVHLRFSKHPPARLLRIFEPAHTSNRQYRRQLRRGLADAVQTLTLSGKWSKDSLTSLKRLLINAPELSPCVLRLTDGLKCTKTGAAILAGHILPCLSDELQEWHLSGVPDDERETGGKMSTATLLFTHLADSYPELHTIRIRARQISEQTVDALAYSTHKFPRLRTLELHSHITTHAISEGSAKQLLHNLLHQCPSLACLTLHGAGLRKNAVKHMLGAVPALQAARALLALDDGRSHDDGRSGKHTPPSSPSTASPSSSLASTPSPLVVHAPPPQQEAPRRTSPSFFHTTPAPASAAEEKGPAPLLALESLDLSGNALMAAKEDLPRLRDDSETETEEEDEYGDPVYEPRKLGVETAEQGGGKKRKRSSHMVAEQAGERPSSPLRRPGAKKRAKRDALRKQERQRRKRIRLSFSSSSSSTAAGGGRLGLRPLHHLASLLPHLPRLHSLSLSNTNLHLEALPDVTDALSQSTHALAQLASLDLSNNQFLLIPLYSPPSAAATATTPPLTRLLTAPPVMPSLVRLDLGHCRLKDAGLSNLLSAIPTLRGLQALLLASNGLSEGACIALFAALAGGGSASTDDVRSLQLPPSSSFSSAGDAAALVSPTPSDASVATTAASPPSGGSGGGGAGVGGFQHIKLKMKKSATVTFQQQQQQQQQQEALPSPSLLPQQQHQQPPLLPALRHLDLCDNGVGDQGASSLATALAHRSLHHRNSSQPPLVVDLRLNPLSRPAAEALVRAMHALRQRGGMAVSLNTRFVRYWGGCE